MMLDDFTLRDTQLDAAKVVPGLELNLEYQLNTTSWILEKVRGSDTYAQHLYSALCNNNFYSADVFDLLRGRYWSCSWRHAGAIVSSLKNKGDYIDWYCSGMLIDYDDLSRSTINGHVEEGTVTAEIRLDLEKLGWKITR
jgi:hypothetical protein